MAEAIVAAAAAAAKESAQTASRVVDEQAERIGGRIRQLRRERGLTLVRLAALTGLSHPFLSQLERGHARPSMVSLQRIADALGSTQVELIASGDPLRRDPDDPRPDVLHAGEGARIPFLGGETRVLAHGARAFDPQEWVGTGTEPGDYFLHGEDEFLYVVAGAVLLDLGAAGIERLEAGDSVYYKGGTQHRWFSADGGEYRVVVVKQKPVDAEAAASVAAEGRA